MVLDEDHRQQRAVSERAQHAGVPHEAWPPGDERPVRIIGAGRIVSVAQLGRAAGSR